MKKNLFAAVLLLAVAAVAQAATTVTRQNWTGSWTTLTYSTENACISAVPQVNGVYHCVKDTTITVTGVNPPPPPPPPVPTVSLSTSPTSTTPGSTVSIAWSSANATTCTAGGAWSGTKTTSGSETSMPLTASSTFTLSCTGAGGSANASASVSVFAAGSQTGLDFPSNGQGNAFVVMQWANPQNIGLPIWGPGNAGVTYTWKVKPRQQTGYHTTFFWSDNANFYWDSGSPNTYLGAHPYPRGGSSGTVHDWEISTEAGDFIYTLQNGGCCTPKVVVKDQWYTQALRVQVNGNGTKTLTFYTALPSTAPSDVITWTTSSSYGNKLPPSPVLTFGDAPWSRGNERLSGVLRGIKIFNKVLSEADTVAEATNDALVTAEGTANVWYLNINPTPGDISDKSGKAHHPSWGSSTLPTLWVQ